MTGVARILVFAKAPVPGTVKTRLLPAIGAHGAAALQHALLRHTLATVCATHYPVELWCSPDADHPGFAELRAQFAVALAVQRGADLGERMASACNDALQRAQYVIIVGSDCPTLIGADLQAAVARLCHDSDAVLGPARDGGYWLIGLRRFDAALFTDVPWGSAAVLGTTLQRLRDLRWRWHLLTERGDIDRPADLDSLPAALRVWEPRMTP